MGLSRIIVHATFNCCETINFGVKLKNLIFIKPDHPTYLLNANGSRVFHNHEKIIYNLAKIKINLYLRSTSLQRQNVFGPW